MTLLLAVLLLAAAAAPLPVAKATLVVGEGLKEPFGVDFDVAGNMYVVEMKGYGGDGGRAQEAQFGGIYAIAFRGNVLYVCDLDNRRIRAVDLATGIVTTVAGNGSKGVPKDGEDALTRRAMVGFAGWWAPARRVRRASGARPRRASSTGHTERGNGPEPATSTSPTARTIG